MVPKIVVDFLNYLKKELNFSDFTISNYQLDLTDFFSFLEKEKINYCNLNRKDVMNYLKYLDNKHLKNNTIARRISCLRSFYNYLMTFKIVDRNIFKSVKNPKIERKLPNYLNYNEIEDILESIDISTPKGLRDRLLIEMFYATGCRVSELINIEIKNINFSNNTIRIMGKGSKERIVYFGEYARMFLDRYLKVLNNTSNDYLFLNDNMEKLTVQEVENIITNIVKQVSIKTHVTPHTLRHTFATHLLNNGADIKTVQELLGHSNLSTTGIYTHVSSDRIKDVYFKTFKR